MEFNLHAINVNVVFIFNVWKLQKKILQKNINVRLASKKLFFTKR